VDDCYVIQELPLILYVSCVHLSTFQSWVLCYPEIFNNVAAASADCPLCNLTSAADGKTNAGQHRSLVEDTRVCPRCRHALSDAVAVDEFARHSHCSRTSVGFFHTVLCLLFVFDVCLWRNYEYFVNILTALSQVVMPR